MQKYEKLLSLEEIEKVVKKLDKTIDKNNVVVLLRGDLAAGKTTLVKEFVKYKGISESVTSPTFSIQTQYSKKLFHYDVYNKSLEEFISLGLLEEFEKKGVHFVEWGDDSLEEILNSYGFETLNVRIFKENDKRRYIIES